MSEIEFDAIARLIDRLSQIERLALMEKLMAAVKRDVLPAGQETSAAPWADFVNRTYGILADDPIERPDQGNYENRPAVE